MPLADEVLARLLLRGQRAAVKSSLRAVQESFRDKTSPYWSLSLDDRDRCHMRFIAAERANAVELWWAKQGGDDRPLERVRLRNVANLASFVGVDTVQTQVAQAHALLGPWISCTPRVAQLVAAWGLMKPVRGLTPADAVDVADALRVLDALASRPGEDQIVRSLSVSLFANSKRIEQLTKPLDVLTAESVSAPARHWGEVFAQLGLVKEPQPFLVAGTGSIDLSSGQCCPIVKPFVGVSNKAVRAYVGAPQWVLTIENLTTFHLASQLLDGRAGLIVFTGGMPSPSWCRAYACLLTTLSPMVPAYHWGDIDQGGFRIAAFIKKECLLERPFLPWLMDASLIPAPSLPTSEAVRGAMAALAVKAGWTKLAETIRPVCMEQEGIQVALPPLL